MANVVATITVDWEGEHLKDANIQAMILFRHRFPDIPLTHFICPAYFTRGGDNHARTEAIRSTFRAGDEIALHVHCWQTLMEAAGVVYQAAPTWYPNNGTGTCVAFGQNQQDCGHGVPLGLYEVDDIVAVLTNSRQLLDNHGLIDNVGDCVSFRCGGWVACTRVFQALQQAGGFFNDASGAPGRYFADVIYQEEPVPLYQWLGLLWGPDLQNAPVYLVNSLSQPVYPYGVRGLGDQVISQPDVINGLVEVPDTGALADYASHQTMDAYIQTAFQLLGQDDLYVSLGFHQETAADPSWYNDGQRTNIEELAEALAPYYAGQVGEQGRESAADAAADSGKTLTWSTIRDVGKRVKAARAERRGRPPVRLAG